MKSIFYKGESLNLDLFLTDDGGSPLSGVSKVFLRFVSDCNKGSTSAKQATYNSSTGHVTASFEASETLALGHRTSLEIKVLFSNGNVRIGSAHVGDFVANEIYSAS